MLSTQWLILLIFWPQLHALHVCHSWGTLHSNVLHLSFRASCRLNGVVYIMTGNETALMAVCGIHQARGFLEVSGPSLAWTVYNCSYFLIMPGDQHATNCVLLVCQWLMAELWWRHLPGNRLYNFSWSCHVGFIFSYCFPTNPTPKQPPWGRGGHFCDLSNE